MTAEQDLPEHIYLLKPNSEELKNITINVLVSAFIVVIFICGARITIQS